MSDWLRWDPWDASSSTVNCEEETQSIIQKPLRFPCIVATVGYGTALCLPSATTCSERIILKIIIIRVIIRVIIKATYRHVGGGRGRKTEMRSSVDEKRTAG